MKRIDANTVELGPQEMVLKNIHEGILDQGYGIVDATELMLKSKFLKRHGLDKYLTPKFVAYLNT